ncbi:MAG: OmpA family protein [Chitinophagaceae bacterium]
MNIFSLPKRNICCSASFIAKGIAGRSLLLIIGCIVLMNAQGQADKRLVLADEYFAAGDYFTAAGLYEQFLNPGVKEKTATGFPLNSKKNGTGRTGGHVSKLDILYKQAESYRLANYWPQAAARYKECFEQDSLKYAGGLYWYGVAQRTINNYPAAEESISNFLSTSVADASYQQAAEKELKTIQFIKSQVIRPDSVLYTIQKINVSFGNEKGNFAPVATTGNQYMITSTQGDSVVKTGINPYHNRLFYSTLSDGSLQNLEPVTIDGMDPAFNQGAASISANGNYLYFTQWKKEKGQTISSIYYSQKKENGWSSPVILSTGNEDVYNSKQPFCTADGKYLFFASDRPGGSGQFDLWYAALQPDGTIADPVNAGGVINTDGNEQAPFYHGNTNTLVFSSDRTPGMGGYDLFTSKGWETEWKAAENMGHPVNSSRDDLYFFTSQKEALLTNAIISSDRGSDCCLETYTVSKTPKRKMVTGNIVDCRNNEPLADADVQLQDGTGKNLYTKTNSNGEYRFELLTEAAEHRLFISKELYKDKADSIATQRIDESDWKIDFLLNSSICLEKKLVIKPETVVTLYFDFDMSELKNRSTEQLDSIYTVLTEDSTATIQISGFTDGRGTVEYNKVLSDKRAKACADYLIQKGIDTRRITFESFGACCPVEMELINGRDNADGRSKNRRALINITKD